jgi:hypothetical protein
MAMAAAPTDIAMSGDAVVRRRRGKSRGQNFKYDGPVSVIRMELDVSDQSTRRRVERQWAAVFRLRRALQRDAQHRCRAYSAAHRERAADAKSVRERLGLSRKGIEAVAKAHIEASEWMRDHLTKAIGLHVANEVWETVDRHLFADSSGRRHGPPRIGSWWEFPRSWWPGRSAAPPSSKPLRSGRPRKPGRGTRRWIGRGVTPTPTSTAPRRGNSSGRNGAPRKGCRPGRSPIPAGRGRPAPMACRCAPTATTRSPAIISAPAPITPPTPGRPDRPNRPVPASSQRGSSPPTVVQSPSRTVRYPRGPGCGARGFSCSAPGCLSRRWRSNVQQPVAGCAGSEPGPPR